MHICITKLLIHKIKRLLEDYPPKAWSLWNSETNQLWIWTSLEEVCFSNSWNKAGREHKKLWSKHDRDDNFLDKPHWIKFLHHCEPGIAYSSMWAGDRSPPGTKNNEGWSGKFTHVVKPSESYCDLERGLHIQYWFELDSPETNRQWKDFFG